MNGDNTLPSYLEQSETIRNRFQRIYERPVKLKVENLGKAFHGSNGEVTALRNINLEVHRREFVSIIGPSGCGKSTLIRILAGLDIATSGRFLLEGKQVSGPGPDRGMVFQSYTLFPWLTVKKNVMFGMEVSNRDVAYDSEAMQWISLVGLEKFADAYPSQLSGGMKQRVAIARALANQPQILFMDEPFGALDAQTRSQMQAYLRQIWRNVDVTIVFVTHDLDEAVYLSDRIVVLKANPGEVQEIIEVPVPRPRSPEQFTSPEFLATRKHIEFLIHPVKQTHFDALPLGRMTNVRDNVD
jgi:NitT/TauT family transport system ATP-binding protein